MKMAILAAFTAVLAGTYCSSVLAESLHGKFVNHPPSISDKTSTSTVDLDALGALQNVKTPLQAQVSLYEYGESIRKAKLAIDSAVQSGNLNGSESLQSALNNHSLALRFWKECLVARNEFLCDENRPSAAEVLQRYPIPRSLETISRRSVVEALDRYPKPWVTTRIRYTLREVVEYIPIDQQRKAFKLLLQQATEDTKQAAIALGRP